MNTKNTIRDHYAKVARGDAGCCGPACPTADYAPDEIAAAPEGADLGLGCGNPHAFAGLRAGETVLDLGCGAGFDCFVAADRVGPSGRVIGVDMTPEMIERARAHAAGAENVEFRLGEIEHLPVADRSVDVILSNCVVNLAPDKRAVFREAQRVLRPGGRLAIMDVVATGPMPVDVAARPDALVGCVAGAVPPATIERILRDLGFEDVRIDVQSDRATDAHPYVASASIEAVQPRGGRCC